MRAAEPRHDVRRLDTCNIFGQRYTTVQMVGIVGPHISRRASSRPSNEATMTLWPSEIAYLDSDGALFRVSRERLSGDERRNEILSRDVIV